MHRNHLEILFKCRFIVHWSPVGSQLQHFSSLVMLMVLVPVPGLSNKASKNFLENKVGIYSVKILRCIFIVCNTTDFLRENLEVSKSYFNLEIRKKSFPPLKIVLLY